MANRKRDERSSPQAFVNELRAESDKGWVVVNWSPDPHRGPETEVHLVCFKGSIALIMRLKSREAVQELMAALAKNRDLIWPTQ